MKTILWITIGVLLLFVVCAFYERISNRNILRNSNILNVAYVFLLGVMSFICIKEVNDYIYPEDENVFCNTDYRTLTHLGYKIKNGFALVDQQKPSSAIWDSREGKIILNDSSIVLQKYYEPFYVKKIKPSRWELQNCYLDIDVNSGFTLLKNHEEIYRLEIKPIEKDKNHFHYISYWKENDKNLCDTSTFRNKIQIGYPFLEIVRQTPLINDNIINVFESLFEGATLSREILYKDSKDRERNALPALRLCINSKFFSQRVYSIQNAHVNSRSSIEIPYKESITFYSGVGSQKSDELELHRIDGDYLSLNFVLSKRQHFPKWSETLDSLGRTTEQHLFILSSPLAVTEKSTNKGYLFDYFNDSDNKNQIDAVISYTSGNATNNVNFNIIDYKRNNSDLTHIESDEPFYLHTDNDIEWIFNIDNLRDGADHSLKPTYIYLFIALLFLLVSFRVLTDKLFSKATLSFIELSIYICILCFGVIRLILMWRVITFPPITGVTPTVWGVMRDSTYPSTLCFLLLVPVMAFVLLSLYPHLSDTGQLQSIIEYNQRLYIKARRFLYSKVWFVKLSDGCEKTVVRFKRLGLKLYYTGSKPIGYNWNRFLYWLMNDGDSQFKKVFYFVLFIVGCYFSQKIVGQVANICIPVIGYILFDWWILSNTMTERTLFSGRWHCQLERILLIVILLVYWLFIDKGIIPVFVIFLIIKYIVYGILRKNLHQRQWVTYVISLSCAIVLGLFLAYEGEILLKVMPSAQSESYIAKKARTMRWRAEAQNIRSNEDLALLMQECDYDSNDVEMLMRSVHNQWFINQYIQLGNHRDRFMRIQPHSNQGSPYPTQTTDLVTTRYILAEHGAIVVFYMMLIFLLLVIIYGLENGLCNKENFAAFNGLLFLYTIAFAVYLSSTNRIVFIGQDFPLISLQSRTATLFPALLFFIAIVRAGYVRFTDRYPNLEEDTIREWSTAILPALSLVIFSISTLFIKVKGVDVDNNAVFNISTHIDNISEVIDRINDDFIKYQSQEEKNINKIGSKEFGEVWKRFTQDGEYNQYYTRIIEQKSAGNFIPSLLENFTTYQRDKTNPDKLLHLRRSNFICLTVNKQYYYVSNIDEQNNSWKGNLIASSDVYRRIKRGEPQRSFVKLPLINGARNTFQILFRNGWSKNNDPLQLIYVDQGNRKNEERFEIITTGGSSISSFRHNVMATAVPDYSILNVFKKYNGVEKKLNGKPKENKRDTQDKKYLAKIIWLNGEQHHFYPQRIGRMWDYEFTQWLSGTVSKMPDDVRSVYEHRDVALTLDYDLYESLEKTAKMQYKQNKFRDVVAVAIDGDGRIRAMFNYLSNQKNTLNPNDSRQMNKKINEMYIEGSSTEMRKMFGSSALLPIPSGPGSTFKPIVYTAVTSRMPIQWESINLKNKGNIPQNLVNSKSESDKYNYYGGVELSQVISIDGAYGSGQNHNDYILRSNNMYHSVVVLLGMMNNYRFDSENFNRLLQDYQPNKMDKKLAFPLFSYNNEIKCFNPHEWWFGNHSRPDIFINDNSALSRSLESNFGIQAKTIYDNESQYCSEYYGNVELLKQMNNNKIIHRNWASPEVGSQNTANRRAEDDLIKHGFNQMFLGASPLQLTPLQMCVNTLRLATLNRADKITTIFEGEDITDYAFFDIDDGWKSQEDYLHFYQRQVLSQMREVPIIGTASGLSNLSKDMRQGKYGNKPLYLYCKTGTLNVDGSKKKRIKHLMVIISDQELEKIEKLSDFRKAKRYIMYLSCYEIVGLSNSWWRPFIESALNSASFKNYMEE